MAKKLWGGRFTKEIDKDFFEFQKSIHYDYKLAKYDVVHSLIHVLALGWAKVLNEKEKKQLLSALKEIREKIEKGKFKVNKKSEDIHTEIQNQLMKKIGKLADKIHAFRSRNDQIVFDEKGYCYDNGATIEKLLDELLKSIKFLKNKYKNNSFVGYTHTQRAQKVSFKDYIGVYQCMFERDQKRIASFWKDLEIHIGAGALAGSPIKGKYGKAIKSHLKEGYFITPSVNTLDDVSDRDFIIEFLSILSILQMHLSRLAEDFILYSTQEFNFINLPEEFCTGSSRMPQKKNPDFMELTRGYTGRIYGNLVSVLTTMKGLPLTYNRDMQLDKEPLFSSVKIIEDEISIMAKLLKKVELNVDSITEALLDENLYATDRADSLVLKNKMPFKNAHDIVGKEIRLLEARIAKLPVK